MAKIKFFVRVSKKSPQANIRIRFYHGRLFDLTASTSKQINPSYWNNDKGNVRQRAEFKDADNLQKDLDNLKAAILAAYNSFPDKSQVNTDWLVTEIDKHYNPGKYLQKNTTLFGFIQHFIDNSKKRINPKTGNPISYKMRREYQVTFEYLKEYAKEYGEPDFIDIDLEFYQQFVAFLRKKRLYPTDDEAEVQKGLSTNTVGKKITTLKIFLNAAAELSINPYQKYKSRNFAAMTEEVDNIYLDHEELVAFYNYDFTDKPRLEKVRDLFIVGAWTGLRYSDLQQITPNKIKGNYIELKQQKTGKKVTIPVHFMVKEILDKYKGKLPKSISNQKYNDYLKEAAKDAGINGTYTKAVYSNGMKHDKKFEKHELISSHTARRSFCTNAYKDDIPTIAIMAISGHQTESSFLRYIKADADEHAKKVFEIWSEKGEFVKAVK